MATPASLVELPFGGGLDEAQRHELVDPRVSFTKLENVRQNDRGGVSKRYGFTVLATGAMNAVFDLDDAQKLFADRDTMVRVGTNTSAKLPALLAYDPTSAKWAPQYGRPSECAARVIDLPSVSKTSYLQDVAYANGYLAVTWYSSPASNVDCYAAVVHAATGTIVSRPQKVGAITTATPGYLVSVGNYFILVRGDSGTAAIEAHYLNTTTAASIYTGWVAMTDLATDLGTPFRYAVASMGGNRAAIAYINDSGGTDRVTVQTFDHTGTLETDTIATASTTPDAVDCAGISTDTLWVSWNQGTAVKLIGYDPDDLTTVLATTATVVTATTGVALIGLAPCQTTAGTGRIIVNSTAAVMQCEINGWMTSGGAVLAGGETVIYAAQAAGRPFSRGNVNYVPVYAADASNLQMQVTLANFTNDVSYVLPVACPAPGLATLDLTGKRTIVAVGNKHYMPLSIRRSGVTDGAALVELDFKSTKRFQPARVGNSTYLSGGLTTYTDGIRCAEAGFLYRPAKPTQTNGATGITGTFRVVAVYEEVDADGNWHQSGVSTPSDAVTVSNKTITWSTVPLTVTHRLSAADYDAIPVRVAWYRTATGGEPPYYRLGTTINDPQSGAVTFADNVADATLTANAKLYSQPGVMGAAQDRRPPPGLGIIAEYRGMLVGAADNELWHSGQPISGEGTWFNPIFSVPFPDEITGLASQDGVLVVFTRRAIYALSGEPPSDNAAVGGLGTPQRLSADVGCIEPRSVCVTAMGTFFQSERGIEILTRARTLEWIGEGIKETLAAFPIVTAATFDPTSSCVLIECAASESAGLVTGSGRTLVYDTSTRRWQSTDRRANYAGTADTPAQSACMVYTGSAYRYAWMDATGRVYTEDQTTHLDPASTWVTMRAETGWFKLAGLQGSHVINRALLLARRSTDHNFSAYAAYDYSTSYKTVDTWNRAAIATLIASWPTQQLDYPLHVDSKGQSMRLKLEDASPTGGTVGTGEGATWVALTIEGTPKEGAAKLPSIAR